MSAPAYQPSDTARAGRLLKPEEAAERLNVSLRFIRRLCHERRLPYTKVGKFVRFDADELEAWITAQRVEPANGEPGDPADVPAEISLRNLVSQASPPTSRSDCRTGNHGARG
jgi:excisionase family DNA binding protein